MSPHRPNDGEPQILHFKNKFPTHQMLPSISCYSCFVFDRYPFELSPEAEKPEGSPSWFSLVEIGSWNNETHVTLAATASFSKINTEIYFYFFVAHFNKLQKAPSVRRWMIRSMNNEIEGLWKEASLAQLKVLSRLLATEIVEDQKEFFMADSQP